MGSEVSETGGQDVGELPTRPSVPTSSEYFGILIVNALLILQMS